MSMGLTEEQWKVYGDLVDSAVASYRRNRDPQEDGPVSLHAWDATLSMAQDSPESATVVILAMLHKLAGYDLN